MDWGIIFVWCFLGGNILLQILEHPKKFYEIHRIGFLVVACSAAVYNSDKVQRKLFLLFSGRQYEHADTSVTSVLVSVMVFQVVWNFERIVSDARTWVFGFGAYKLWRDPGALASGFDLLNRPDLFSWVFAILLLLFGLYPQLFTWPFVYAFHRIEAQIERVRQRLQYHRNLELCGLLEQRFGQDIALMIAANYAELQAIEQIARRIESHVQKQDTTTLVYEIYYAAGVDYLQKQAFEGLFRVSRPSSLLEDSSEERVMLKIAFTTLSSHEFGLDSLVSLMENLPRGEIVEKAAHMATAVCLTYDSYYYWYVHREHWNEALQKAARACRAIAGVYEINHTEEAATVEHLIHRLERHDAITHGLPRELFRGLSAQFQVLRENPRNMV